MSIVNDLCPSADRGHYGGQGVDGGGDGVELARPVVGHEDPLDAGLDRPEGVARPQDPLEDDGQLCYRLEPLDVLPLQRLVPHSNVH